MQGIAILLLFYLLGSLLSALIGGFIPGSVLGMVLLFAALMSRRLKAERVRAASRFLLDNMMLFFVPVSVGFITSYALISKYITAIVVASAVSTVLIIVVVGLLMQRFESKQSDNDTTPEKPSKS